MNLRTAAKRAYKGTAVAEYDGIIGEIRRWHRKETIARTKLAEARKKLSLLANRLACQAIGLDPEKRQ